MKIINKLCVLLLVFVSHASLAEDCSDPLVGLGEVLAGLQAGLTAGVANNDTLPGGYDIVASGEARRGFIIPETGVPSDQCDNDYILISEWIACPIINNAGEEVRSPKEAKDCVNNGLDGLIVDHYFEVDGIRVDHIQTATKIGKLPTSFAGRRAAFNSTGHIIEPFSLEPGFHTATAVFVIDNDRDGNPPFDYLPLTAEFTVIDSAAP
jgi:hypothetical protein